MRIPLLTFALLGFLWATAARADTINIMGGYTSVYELGGVQLEIQYRTPNGVPFEASFEPPNGMVALAVSWSPQELPVLVFVERDRNGYWLFLGSLLSDRANRKLCWSQESIAAAGKGPERVWQNLRQAFEVWARTCPSVQTIGEQLFRSRFLAQESNFRRGLAWLVGTPHPRFVPSERMVGMPSFLPQTVSQPLLDAVADACGGSRDRLRLQPDGKITFDFNPRLPNGADGTRSFDSCVNEQIRYFPGYWTAY